MLQSGRGPTGTGQMAANSLHALLRKSKKPAVSRRGHSCRHCACAASGVEVQRSPHLGICVMQLLTADQVEFWHDPEKAGWMHSQGEHIRTWRKRWFVLKQVNLMRDSAEGGWRGTMSWRTRRDCTRAGVPLPLLLQRRGCCFKTARHRRPVHSDRRRGWQCRHWPPQLRPALHCHWLHLLPLRKRDFAGKTAVPWVCARACGCPHLHLVVSRRSPMDVAWQVEWYSALEGAVAKIVKLVAGVDEGEEDRRASTTSTKSWTEQLVQTYSAAGGSWPEVARAHPGGRPRAAVARARCCDALGGACARRAGSATDADMTRGGNAGGSKATGGERGQPQMVSVVNYETPGSVGVGGYRSRTGAHSSGPGGPNYVTVDYGSIAGEPAVPCLTAWAAPQTGALQLLCSMPWRDSTLHAGATTVQDGEPAPGDKAAAAEPYGPYSTIVGYTSHVQAQGRMQYAAYPFAVSQPTPENAVQHQPLAGGSGGGGNLMDAVTAPQASAS